MALILPDGTRAVLGQGVGDLRNRGLIAVVDGLRGLLQAIRRPFPGPGSRLLSYLYGAIP